MFEKLIARFARLISSPIGLTGNAARTKRRPVGAALRDPTEFYQSNALEAALLKRRRRATKLHAWALWSADNNRAHYDEFDNLHDRLNPFYVAK